VAVPPPPGPTRSRAEPVVLQRAHVDRDRETEQVVNGILDVIEPNALLVLGNRVVFFRVHKYRRNRLHRHGQNLLCELGLSRRIDGDGVDFRFLDFRHVVLALFPVARDVVVRKIRICDADDVVFRKLLHARDFAHCVLPILMGDIRTAHGRHPRLVGLQPRLLGLLEVRDDGRNDPILEFTVFHEFDLIQKQMLHLFERLTFLRDSP